MATKKKWVAFKTSAIIPKDVLGQDKDKKVSAREPVQLPGEYADHVVHDGFAERCDAPKRGKKPAPKVDAATKSNAATGDDPAKPNPATDDPAQKRAAASARVDALNAQMADMAETDAGYEGLKAQLDEAVTDLAALQGAA